MVFSHAVVTGGAGFVGARLCAKLLAQGTRVTAVDNFSTAPPGALDPVIEDPRFRLLDHDVTKPIPVPGPVDAVFHLASPASPRAYLDRPLATLRAGSAGTENALSIATAQHARFVLASTSEVYGDPLEHPQRESYWGNVNPIGPRSVYDEAKRYAEALASATRRSKGTDTAIARIFNTYGPGMRADDGRMVPAFVTQALSGAPLTVEGSGRQTRSLCYLDDTVAGLLALAASGHPGPVNLGNPHELSVREIAEQVLAITGSRSRIVHVAAAEDDPRRRCPDISLARRVLGWTPRVSAGEGLRRTADWFAARRVAV
ncbi:NAD-dependent epimerase/dehydratase family protein [Amycolatopsis benzoatilytica]|uniref:NAD-dependent epimerase/dehydratase family protein n=1 Tax=Amycolatopsis benzoatilytica TaxID=346045 RepID=UPI00035D48F3|nr:NAD-dependent epimerase/dehydratase family protein [Amycolatopsis benzoatilytica]